MATLTITSNGLPNPAQFGKPFGQNAFSPSANVVGSQSYNFSFTYRGGENTSNPQLVTSLTPIGIMNNGVVFFSPSILLPNSHNLVSPITEGMFCGILLVFFASEFSAISIVSTKPSP